MTFYIGQKKAGEIFLGDKKIGRVYLGQKLVHMTQKAGGRFVESIVFDGASWINTGIAHQTCDIECTIKFEETGTRQLMGFGSSSAQYWGKAANQATLEWFSGTNVLDKTDVRIEYNTDDPTAPTRVLTADGKTSATSTGTAISQFPYIIGCLKNSLTNATMYYPFTGQVWGQKTYIGGELAQDLRPYVDGDGVACFKDVVTDTLFYNKGTGTLTYTEHEELEYLELDGTKYIDTLITEKGGTWSVTASGDDSAQLRFLIGNGGSATQYFGTLANGYWGVGTQGEDPYFEILRTEKITAQVVFEDYKITAVIDGVTKYKSGSTLSNNNFLLCGYSSVNYRFKGNVYHCSYTNTNGKLVLDLIPVKRSDGVVCMYDRVDNKYYELKGA